MPRRRSMLAALAAAAVASPAANAAPDPDARLIALCREAITVGAEAWRAEAPLMKIKDEEARHAPARARADALLKHRRDLDKAIEGHPPARTPRGNAARLRVELARITDLDGQPDRIDDVETVEVLRAAITLLEGMP